MAKRKKPTTPAAPLATADLDGMTPAEREEDEQVGFIQRLRRQGLDGRRICEATRARFGIGRHRTYRLLALALEGLRDEVERNRPFTRPEQIVRLRAYLAQLNASLATEQAKTRQLPDGTQESATDPLTVSKLIDSIVKVERLLAETEGNKVPDEIVVHAEIRQAMQAVLVNMTPERTQQLLEQAVERKRLAAATKAS